MYERSYANRTLVQDVPKARKPFPWRTVLWCLLAVGIAVGFVWFLRYPRAQVETIHVVGATVISESDITSYIQERMSGNYLKYIPRSSIILVGPKHLEVLLKAHFPRIRDIKIDRANLTTLSVNITEYKGSYLWCAESENRDIPCSFMSDDGVVFASAPYFSGSAYIKLFGEEALLYPTYPLDAHTRDQVRVLQEKLSSINIEPTEFHFVSPHNTTIIFSHNEHDTKLMIDPTIPLDDTLQVLYGGLRTSPVSDLYRDQHKMLEYLDVRFSGKLVYKFQE